MIAAQVLSARIGRLAAQLMSYDGVRILQDNVLWKPPGAKAVGFHQDGSYADYLVPPGDGDVLDDAARHRRGRRPHRVRSRLEPLGCVAAGADRVPRTRRLARGRPGRRTRRHRELDVVPVVVKAGGGAFHHNATWHGSEPNRNASVARMGLVSHMLPAHARFHETNVDLNYSRYRRRDDPSMDESFFPVLWDRAGYRTPWLRELPDLDGAAASDALTPKVR